MTSYRRKVVDVHLHTSEQEIKRVEKHYKSGASLVTKTIEQYTGVYAKLECGHLRQQHNGMRDITKAKSLDCYECELLDKSNS